MAIEPSALRSPNRRGGPGTFSVPANSGGHPKCGVDPVEEVGDRNHQDQSPQLPLVVVLSGLGDGLSAIRHDRSGMTSGALMRGSTGWTMAANVLDVAEDAASVHFGLLLAGAGAVDLAQPHFEVVDTDVPVTKIPRRPLAAGPQGLDFGIA